MSTLEDRVERLERSAKLWRGLALGLVGVVAVGAAVGLGQDRKKSMTLDRLHVTEEILIGDTETAFIALGAVEVGQDITTREAFIESNQQQLAYIKLWERSSNAQASIKTGEHSASQRLFAEQAHMFCEVSNLREEGRSKLVFGDMLGGKKSWSFGTGPKDVWGSVHDGETRHDVMFKPAEE